MRRFYFTIDETPHNSCLNLTCLCPVKNLKKYNKKKGASKTCNSLRVKSGLIFMFVKASIFAEKILLICSKKKGLFVF